MDTSDVSALAALLATNALMLLDLASKAREAFISGSGQASQFSREAKTP